MTKSSRVLSCGLLALGLGSIVALQSCGTVPTTQEGMAEKRAEVVPVAQQTLKTMMGKDPSIEDAMNDAYGYAVFPTVASGALIIGGEGGDGVVFEGDSPWGLAKLAKGSIGAQIGGEAYSELVILTTEEAFKNFVAGDFQFSAGLTATASPLAVLDLWHNGIGAEGGAALAGSISSKLASLRQLRLRDNPLAEAGGILVEVLPRIAAAAAVYPAAWVAVSASY